MVPTVIERYCRLHRINPAEFTTHLLQRTLHGPGRLLRPFLLLLFPLHFATDRTYLDCVGRCRSLDQLRIESADFRRQRANRRFTRRVLHLRVSVRRVHATIAPLFG